MKLFQQLIMPLAHTLCNSFGFNNVSDLVRSIIDFRSVIVYTDILFIFGGISTISTYWLGFNAHVLAGFAVLITGHSISGVALEIKQGDELSKMHFIKFIPKLFIFSSILFIMNAFTKVPPYTIAGLEINIWSYLFNLCSTIIFFVLLKEFFSNLAELGFKWAGTLSKIINTRLNKLTTNTDDSNKKP